LTYELVINGETFFIEANQQTKLRSQLKPGLVYDVALQVAMEQHVRLDRVQFDYDWPAKVQQTRRHSQITVRVRHELGFTFIITEMGGATEKNSQLELLKSVADSVADSFRRSGVKNLNVSEPRQWKFENASGHGVRLNYQDEQGTRQTGLVCVLGGRDFTASCIAHYLDADAEIVQPRLKKIFDSIRPLGRDTGR